MKHPLDPVWHLEAKLEAAVARGVRWSTPAASARVREVRAVPKSWSALQACDAISSVFDLWRVLSAGMESSSLFVTLPDLVKFTFAHTYRSSFLATAKLSQFAAAIDQAVADVECTSQVSTRCHLFLRLLNESDMRCFTCLTIFLQNLVPTGFDAILQLVSCERRVSIQLSGGTALLRSFDNSCPIYETTDIETGPVADGFSAMLQISDSQHRASLFNEVFADANGDINVVAEHRPNKAKEARTRCGNVAAKKPNHGTTKRHGQASKCMIDLRSESSCGSLLDLDMLLNRICDCFCPVRANKKLPVLLPDSTVSKRHLPDGLRYVPQAGTQYKHTNGSQAVSHDQQINSSALLSAQSLLIISGYTMNSSNHGDDRRVDMMRDPTNGCKNSIAQRIQTSSCAAANFPAPLRMLSTLKQDNLPIKEKPNEIQHVKDEKELKRLREGLGSVHSDNHVDIANNLNPMVFVCSKYLLRGAAEAVVSFEELRAVAFVLKCKRMTTVTFRLVTGRSITLRCTAVETAFEVRKRICDLLKIAMTDANLVACDSAPMRDDTFICRKANHNNSTVWVLPESLFSNMFLARPMTEGVVSKLHSETSCFGKATMSTTATLWRKTMAAIQSSSLGGSLARYQKPAAKIMPLSIGVVSSANQNQHRSER